MKGRSRVEKTLCARILSKYVQTNSERTGTMEGRLSVLERMKRLWVNDANNVVSKGFSDKEK